MQNEAIPWRDMSGPEFFVGQFGAWNSTWNVDRVKDNYELSRAVLSPSLSAVASKKAHFVRQRIQASAILTVVLGQWKCGIVHGMSRILNLGSDSPDKVDIWLRPEGHKKGKRANGQKQSCNAEVCLAAMGSTNLCKPFLHAQA